MNVISKQRNHRLLDKLNQSRLGFEEEYITYAKYHQKYDNLFSVQLMPVKNLIESIRLIKTDEEINIEKKRLKLLI